MPILKGAVDLVQIWIWLHILACFEAVNDSFLIQTKWKTKIYESFTGLFVSLCKKGSFLCQFIKLRYDHLNSATIFLCPYKYIDAYGYKCQSMLLSSDKMSLVNRGTLSATIILTYICFCRNQCKRWTNMYRKIKQFRYCKSCPNPL